jgi:streptogramin lyase
VEGVPYLTEDNLYNRPKVSLDADQNILITEEYGQRLIKLTPGGNLIWSFGVAGVSGGDDNHLANPMIAAADSRGNIYVPNHWGCNVSIISSSGVFSDTLGEGCGNGDYQFDQPMGAAIDSNDHIYVADMANNRVSIFNQYLEHIGQIGGNEVCDAADNHLCQPEAVAVDSAGNIFVDDSGNMRVQKFDSDLQWQMTIGTGDYGSQFDQFARPNGIAVDAQGKIYVSEWDNPRIQVFDPSGAYLTTIGGARGIQSAQFNGISSVAVDGDGNVYASDAGNHRIQKYAPGVPDWKQVNINGFGSPTAATVTIRPFNGQLYAGAGDWAYGAQVWRTADGTTWNLVTTPGEGLGAFSGVILGMIEFGGQFYVGTGWGGSPPEIWRTSNGTDWEQVMVSTNGDAASVSAFAVFENKLYAALPDGSEDGGVAIYRSSSGNEGSWLPNLTHGGGDVRNTNIKDFALFNNQLYAVGDNTSTGAFVWRYDGSSWTQVNTPGFDDTTQNNAQSIAVFNDTLYVGTFCYQPLCTAGYEGAIYKSINGTDWSLVVTGFEQAGYGDVTSLYAFDGALFAAVAGRSEGNTIWRTMDGTSWQQVNIDGWGDSNNDFSMCDYAITSFNNQLYVGTTNYSNGTSDITSNLANGTEIWRYEPKVTASFTATPTSGTVPLEVTFTNTSTGTLTASLWDFGDGMISTEISPTHTYQAAGVYSVTLTADSFGNTDMITKANLITVENLKFFLPVVRR